uniref:Uncharacterized protein n=1 Tax=Acrobeloides nanus TaxID=290746 RepID=A0A914EDI1_9BILA
MFELSLKLAPDDCIEIEHFDTDTCLIGLEFTIPECNDSIQTLLQEARDLYTTQDKMLDFIGKQYRVKIDFVHLEPKILNDGEELLVPDQTIHYLKTHDSALFACFTYLKQQETMLIFGQ